MANNLPRGIPLAKWLYFLEERKEAKRIQRDRPREVFKAPRKSPEELPDPKSPISRMKGAARAGRPSGPSAMDIEEGLRAQMGPALEMQEKTFKNLLRYQRTSKALRDSGPMGEQERVLIDYIKGQTEQGKRKRQPWPWELSGSGTGGGGGGTELLKPLPDIPQNMEEWSMKDWLRINSLLQEGEL